MSITLVICIQPMQYLYYQPHRLTEVLAVPPLFLQESSHSSGMEFSRRPC